MDSFTIFGFSGLLLVAATAFWIDQYRFALFTLGAAAIVAMLGDDIWVHGMFGAVLGSPLLLVLIPLAKRAKRKRNEKTRPRAAKATIAVNQTQDHAMNSEKEANRKAGLEMEHRQRMQAMSDRLEADPVSAILRRQVPVRFDETAASWLGGLPQMPDDIPWPRGGDKNWPLHFAAQISCADLPDRLWKGEGPRDGWLLLFIDGYRIGGGGDEEDDGATAVIHIDRLGPERQPPDDLHGVQDLIMSGASYPQAFEQSRVPRVWRKWPLDIVEQEQHIAFDRTIAFTRKPFAPEPATAEELYGIASPSQLPKLDPETCPPRTWQGVLDFVNAVTNQQRIREKQPVRDLTARLRTGEGWLKRLIAETEEALENRVAQRDEFARELSELVQSAAQSAEVEKRRRFLEEKGSVFARLIASEQDCLERLTAYATDGGEAALDAEILASVSGRQHWWKTQGTLLNDLREDIEAKDPGAVVSGDEWCALHKRLVSIRYPAFRSRTRGSQGVDALLWGSVSLAERIWGGDLLTQHYLDLYVQSPETQRLIPEPALETVEHIARAIRWSRPHRMGGLADPLQSEIGPEDGPLLFQIASDDAMNWMWGDAGAIFMSTSDVELSARRFDTFAILECH